MFESSDDLFAAVRIEIAASAHNLNPECAVFELTLGTRASLPLVRPSVGVYANGEAKDLPELFQKHFAPLTVGKTLKHTVDTVPFATVESILFDGDAAARSIAQRAASRGIVFGVQDLDGYKYTFNNSWAGMDDDGMRFAYICQDSLQNKDRHANGFHKTQKTRKGVYDTFGPRKETYNCKGSISIKFSRTKRHVEIQYRHYAMHDTVADRELSARIQPKAPAPPQTSITHKISTPGPVPAITRTLKRKISAIQVEQARPMSLADLLWQSSCTGYTSPASSVGRDAAGASRTVSLSDSTHQSREAPSEEQQSPGPARVPAGPESRFVNQSSGHPGGATYIHRGSSR